MRPWIRVILLSMALAGCQSVQNLMPGNSAVKDAPAAVKRQVAFPIAAYAKFDKKGTATIKGRLMYMTSQGKRIYGANEKISIAPVTTYSAEAADVALSGRRIEPADPRASEYTHFAKTDSQGYFAAHDIPAGVFYVAGSVLLPGGKARSPIIIKQVEIGHGKTVSVDLSR